MAKGFVGKDEKLTPGERRLLRAAGSKAGGTRQRGSGTLGEATGSKDKAATGQPGTRTHEALMRAMKKLKRLKSVAESDVASRKQPGPTAGSKPKGVSETYKAREDRRRQEAELEPGLRRKKN